MTGQQSSDGLITLTDVGYSYGNVTVLEEVSLQLPSSSVTAVIGPNGSGKTTLSMIVAGLKKPDAGTISLQYTAERPVAYLPQDPRFRPVLTVEETLQFYADLLSTEASPDDAIERVGLTDVSDRRVDALSGGMRQLLGLAQSILGGPPLVVLDEPTSGLDPRMTRRVFEVISTRADKGASVFLTTHDLEYATEADHLVILHRGRVVAQATPDDLLAQTNSESLTDAFLSVVGTEPGVQSGIRKESR